MLCNLFNRLNYARLTGAIYVLALIEGKWQFSLTTKKKINNNNKKEKEQQ